MSEIKNLVICLFATVCLTNCAGNVRGNQWDTVEINPAICQNSIYKELDNKPELFSALEFGEPLMRRTSDVAYFTRPKINLNQDDYSKFNNCRAYFLHSDTLSIDIGIGNGFGGRGFIINYKNKRFHTEPYYSTDVVVVGEVGPSYKIVYQKLTLDKISYSVGDSLYGYIDFRSIETDQEKHITEHFGKGYFRTKVKKL